MTSECFESQCEHKKAKKVTALIHDAIQQMTSQKYRDCDVTERRMN